MPKVTPDLLREMARNECATDVAGLIEIGDWASGRASAQLPLLGEVMRQLPENATPLFTYYCEDHRETHRLGAPPTTPQRYYYCDSCQKGLFYVPNGGSEIPECAR